VSPLSHRDRRPCSAHADRR